MNNILLNENEIFLEGCNCPSKKISEKDLFLYLDIPLIISNFYIDHLLSLLVKMGTYKLGIIFENSLNGHKLENLLKDLDVDSDNILLPSNIIKLEWYTSNDITKDKNLYNLKDFVRSVGINENGNFSLGKYTLGDIRSLLITIDNSYNVYSDKNRIKFKTTKDITLRMLIDSILDEITINRTYIRNLNIGKDIKEKKIKDDNEISNLKIKLIKLQEDLENLLKNEDFEKCVTIRDEINKINNIIIENGR